jgi:hypothetical protein
MSSSIRYYDCQCGEHWDAEQGNRCRKCGEWHMGRPRTVKVGHSKHECDSRCTNARGLSCNCSCNGRNHGIAA